MPPNKRLQARPSKKAQFHHFVTALKGNPRCPISPGWECFLDTLTIEDTINRLTERELQVYLLYGRGKEPAQIAPILFLSTKTVSTHRISIFYKMGFENSYDLISHCVHAGMDTEEFLKKYVA